MSKEEDRRDAGVLTCFVPKRLGNLMVDEPCTTGPQAMSWSRAGHKPLCIVRSYAVISAGKGDGMMYC